MTFMLPHSEALDFSSDDLNSSCSLHDAFFDESKHFIDYNDFDDPIGFPLSPTLPEYGLMGEASYEIVQEKKLKPDKEGLKLKLRMSNSVSVGPGSVGSSPSDVTDECEILNVEDFLNIPTNDFVTIEESKQVAPSPAYSLSSSSTGPSPLHSSFSPGPSGVQHITVPYGPKSGAHHTTVPYGASSESHQITVPYVANSSTHHIIVPYGASRGANHITVPYNSSGESHQITVPYSAPPRTSGKTKRKISESSVSPSRKTCLKPGSQVCCKVIPIERPVKPNKEVKIKECSEAISVNPNKNVLKRYYEQADILLKNREKEIIEVAKKESVSKSKQGVVIGSMERGPRMFGVRYGPCDRPALDDEELFTVSEVKPVYDVASRYKHNNSRVSDSQLVHHQRQQLKLNANSNSPKLPTRSNFVNQTMKSPEPTSSGKRPISCETPSHSRTWTCPVPKAKIELPPYRPNRQTIKDGKCRRKDMSQVIDLLYQQHLYCSVEKPLFESDPEILKASETYQLLLNTYISLEAQRAATLRDIDTLSNLKQSALKRPYKFIKQLKKGEVVFPRRQRIVKIPEVKLMHRSKEVDICHFTAPSGQMVTKQSEEFAKTTRLKREYY